MNKHLGSSFEAKVCQWLKDHKWWVHFFSPDKTGAQPFDIIAVKNGIALAIDAKTSSTNRFSINRLEENQKTAFDLWLKRGNHMPYVVVQYEDHMIWLTYWELKNEKVIDLSKCPTVEMFSGGNKHE